MTEVLGSGLAFPLSVDRRGAVALAHGETDVEQAIVLILATAPGERPMRPEFGCELHDLVFETVDAATVGRTAAVGRVGAAVRRALARWEPRVDVTAVDVDLAAVASGRLDIRIEYAIRAT